MVYDDLEDRSANLAAKKGNEKKLFEIYRDAQKAYEGQSGRSSDINDYWDIYNCILGRNQRYSGDNELFLPAVYNAVEARVTRFSNQIFPSSGRHIEVVSSDVSRPRALTALAEHYIRKSKLRLVVPSLLVNGDIEGHYWAYVSWNKTTRHVLTKVKKPVMMMGVPTGEDTDDIQEEEVEASYPNVDVLSDCDVVVLPYTAATLDDALDEGGSVTILRRWTEPKIQELIDEGLIDKKKGDQLIKDMSKGPAKLPASRDQEKSQAAAAGVKGAGRGRHALVYETWTKKIDGKITQTFFGAPDIILHCHRNPLWCDRLPIIGHPVRKIHGSYKGRSPVSPVADLQYHINDICNQSADSSNRAMMPVVMTDPMGNPRYDSMVLANGAVWKCNPATTQILPFPQLWQDAEGIIQAKQGQIMQTLGVNPAMITQGFHKSKPSQAEVAQEHAVDLLTTANSVVTVEEGVLTPIVALFMEMDHQYRDQAIAVRAYGELGQEVGTEDIEPIQMDARYAFRWFGVEQARNAQQIQQQISMVNVVQNIPGALYPEYVLDITPVLVDMMDSAFGPMKGRTVFAKINNQQLQERKTLQLQLQSGGPGGGAGGGQGPKPGAQPAAQRPAQQPPGAVHKDNLGAPSMPRHAVG